jgi:hypothetical protein
MGYIDAIYAAGAERGWTEADIAGDYEVKHDGTPLLEGTKPELEAHLAAMTAR